LNASPNLKVVAIGGGTGLASVLRGLKPLSCDITAIVTVADDGGSSGRLRKDIGMLPPGDIRNCLLALAEAEPDMASLFNHRFKKGGLGGHNFGNLFLAAMTEMTGDFQLAVRTMSRILAVRGKVIPATLSDVTLRAEMEDGSVVLGEYAIPQARKRIRRLSLLPPEPPALDEAVSEILGADVIILGPGSLYTSVIPNLLVPGIREAVYRATAPKLYVCNIMTQPGETDGYTASDHVRAIQCHAGHLVSDVLVNIEEAPPEIANKYAEEGRYQVRVDAAALSELGYTMIPGNYLSKGDLARHDSAKLAESVIKFAEAARSSENRGKKVASGS
jgi:uncharacterized cofD-like protein